ncbi:MAG: PfkB family carbohydrate kinase [Nibricoccus sp.]
MTPTLYTLTGNLLWERTLEFASWAPGKTQRARASSFQVGGKGINVARMLARLGAPTEALCFAGGSTGADCTAWLREKNIPHRVFANSEATRTGTVIRSPGQPETTFFSPDVAPDAQAWAACTAFIDQLPANSVLALCGSFPGWTTTSADSLRSALSRFAARATLVADTYGPPLDWAVSQPIALVKINREEFDALAPNSTATEPFDKRIATLSTSSAVRTWIVTDGEKPVWLVEKGAAPRSFTPPAIETISPTGSGDVLLACLLHGRHHRGLSPSDALAYALPYAAANAAHPGVADFNLNNLPH